MLKEAARRVIPNEVIDRPKGYFPVPALKYLQGPYLDLVRDALLAPEARERGLYEPAEVDAAARRPERSPHPAAGQQAVAARAARAVAAVPRRPAGLTVAPPGRHRRTRHVAPRSGRPAEEGLSTRSWDDRPSHLTAELTPDVALECGWGRLMFGQTFAIPRRPARGGLDRGARPPRHLPVRARTPRPRRRWRRRSCSSTRATPTGCGCTVTGAARDAVRGPRRPRPAFRARTPTRSTASTPRPGWSPPRPRCCGPTSAPRPSPTSSPRTPTPATSSARSPASTTGTRSTTPRTARRCGASRSTRRRRARGSAPRSSGALAERFQARGRAFLDLSVVHDNRARHRAVREARVRAGARLLRQAQEPHQRAAVQRVAGRGARRPQPLRAHHRRRGPPARDHRRGARRRGRATCKLTHGGRSMLTRESLSELTTAVAMSRCDDKRVTRRVLEEAGLSGAARPCRRPRRGRRGASSTTSARWWSSRPAANRARASPSGSPPRRSSPTAVRARRTVLPRRAARGDRRRRRPARPRHRRRGRRRGRPPPGRPCAARVATPSRSWSSPPRAVARPRPVASRPSRSTSSPGGACTDQGFDMRRRPRRGRRAGGAPDREPPHRRHHPRRHLASCTRRCGTRPSGRPRRSRSPSSAWTCWSPTSPARTTCSSRRTSVPAWPTTSRSRPPSGSSTCCSRRPGRCPRGWAPGATGVDHLATERDEVGGRTATGRRRTDPGRSHGRLTTAEPLRPLRVPPCHPTFPTSRLPPPIQEHPVSDDALVYPTDQVVGVLPDPAKLDDVLDGLRSADVGDDRVTVLRGRDDADLAPDAEEGGAITTIVRKAQQVLGDEAERLRQLDEALEAGHARDRREARRRPGGRRGRRGRQAAHRRGAPRRRAPATWRSTASTRSSSSTSARPADPPRPRRRDTRVPPTGSASASAGSGGRRRHASARFTERRRGAGADVLLRRLPPRPQASRRSRSRTRGGSRRSSSRGCDLRTTVLRPSPSSQLGVLARYQLRRWLLPTRSTVSYAGARARARAWRLPAPRWRRSSPGQRAVRRGAPGTARRGLTGPAVLGHLGVDGFAADGAFEILVRPGPDVCTGSTSVGGPTRVPIVR